MHLREECSGRRVRCGGCKEEMGVGEEERHGCGKGVADKVDIGKIHMETIINIVKLA